MNEMLVTRGSSYFVNEQMAHVGEYRHSQSHSHYFPQFPHLTSLSQPTNTAQAKNVELFRNYLVLINLGLGIIVKCRIS